MPTLRLLSYACHTGLLVARLSAAATSPPLPKLLLAATVAVGAVSLATLGAWVLGSRQAQQQGTAASASSRLVPSAGAKGPAG